MRVFTWFTIVGLDGTEYMEFIDCRPSRLFNNIFSLLRLVMFDFNGIRQSLATEHLQPCNRYASDI